MAGFLWWIVIGFVAGLLARALMPGSQPMTWMMTIVLGLVGSMVGGFLSSMIFGADPADAGFHASGLVGSTIGAIIVLAAYVAYAQRRITGPINRP